MPSVEIDVDPAAGAVVVVVVVTTGGGTGGETEPGTQLAEPQHP
jgi:hypothetical protein